MKKKYFLFIVLPILIYVCLFFVIRIQAARSFNRGQYDQVISLYDLFHPVFPQKRDSYEFSSFYTGKVIDTVRHGTVEDVIGIKDKIFSIPSKKLIPQFLAEHGRLMDDTVVLHLARYYVHHQKGLNPYQAGLLRIILIKNLSEKSDPGLLKWLDDPRSDLKQGLLFHALAGGERVDPYRRRMLDYLAGTSDTGLLKKTVEIFDRAELEQLWARGNRGLKRMMLESLSSLPGSLRKNILKSGLKSDDPHLLYSAMKKSRWFKDPETRRLLLDRFFRLDDRFTAVTSEALSFHKEDLLEDMLAALESENRDIRRRAAYFLRFYPADRIAKAGSALRDEDPVVRYYMSQWLSPAGDRQAPTPARDIEQIILLICVDTLRKDHLGVYGYGRPTSPGIDAFFSRNSLVFDRCFSHAPWTLPAHVSLLGAQDVYDHGVRSNEDTIGDRTTLLSQALQKEGYLTAAFTTHILVSQFYNFHKGFDIFEYRQEEPAGEVIDRVSQFLNWYISDRRGQDRGLFLFIHLFDTHAPFSPPAPFDLFSAGPGTEGTDPLLNAYDGEIAYTDHQLARLFRWFDRSGLMDRTLAVFTSDHGEEFLDHQARGHGHSLYNELIHVPLLVRSPRFDQVRRSSTLAGIKDIGPSILRRLGLPIPEAYHGRNDLFLQPGGQTEGPVFSEICKDDLHKACVIRGTDKIIYDFVSNRLFYFDLEADPLERQPSSDIDETLASYLMFLKEKSGAGPEEKDLPFLPDEGKERLKALGYIED